MMIWQRARSKTKKYISIMLKTICLKLNPPFSSISFKSIPPATVIYAGASLGSRRIILNEVCASLGDEIDMVLNYHLPKQGSFHAQNFFWQETYHLYPCRTGNWRICFTYKH